ncbi:MAG: hypothetical protein LBK68_00640 [Candidatus Margulisbacteria bacterium]|jgi:hypothetical protein|nr:hypothetical protein [Candidatus Margulisiibacteriota bacterium]
MGEKYPGIRAGNNIYAADVEAALDTKVNLNGNETINGTKTFTTSPVVPGKSTAAGSSNSTVIATEAQIVSTVNAALNTKVSLTGNQTIEGTKTFKVSPVVPPKSTAAGNNPTVIATETQVLNVSNTISAALDAHRTTVTNTIGSIQVWS